MFDWIKDFTILIVSLGSFIPFLNIFPLSVSLAILRPKDNLDDDKDRLYDSDDNGVGDRGISLSLLISRKFNSSSFSNKLPSSLFFINCLQFSIESIIILLDSSYSFKWPLIY